MRIGLNMRHDLKLEGQCHCHFCECVQKLIIKSRSIAETVPSDIKGDAGNYDEVDLSQIDRASRNRLRDSPCSGRYVFFKIPYLKEFELFPFYFGKDYPFSGGQRTLDHQSGFHFASK